MLHDIGKKAHKFITQSKLHCRLGNDGWQKFASFKKSCYIKTVVAREGPNKTEVYLYVRKSTYLSPTWANYQFLPQNTRSHFFVWLTRSV